MKTKLIALLSGGDWADACVDHLVVPDNIDLKEAHKKYKSWYREEYLPMLSKKYTPYLSFTDWLIKYEGAEYAKEQDIVVVEEDYI